MSADGFNPRLPGGRRQVPAGTSGSDSAVSIHAFRGEGDHSCPVLSARSSCFNPRLPGGRRPSHQRFAAAERGFNPRLPGGRRRGARRSSGMSRLFQSTPSGGKATYGITRHTSQPRSFNPRLPGGRRRDVGCADARSDRVSIHAFRGEGDIIRRDLFI